MSSGSGASSNGGSATFTCNLCGTEGERPAAPLDRETPSCGVCGSTTRLRGLVALLSQELLGVTLALPDFPVLKSVCGIGMSDPDGLAARLAEKLNYTNTFYHQLPKLDIVNPDPSEFGRYDFIVSSEVMEHIPPPVERGFAHLCRLLKPNGVLLLTVPYRAVGEHEEHFPDLYQYGLTSLGGRTVLVNRRRDGTTEVFEDLRFHGGDGSTLEMRVYSEESLRQTLLAAGFTSVRIAADGIPEFGVEHGEVNSLPLVARKGEFRPPAAAIAEAYRDGVGLLKILRGEMALMQREMAARDASARESLEELRSDYARHVAFHEKTRAEYEARLAEQTEWVRKTEQLLEERTRWAQDLERERDEAIEHFRRVEREAAEARAGYEALEGKRWVRLGRRVGTIR